MLELTLTPAEKGCYERLYINSIWGTPERRASTAEIDRLITEFDHLRQKVSLQCDLLQFSSEGRERYYQASQCKLFSVIKKVGEGKSCTVFVELNPASQISSKLKDLISKEKVLRVWNVRKAEFVPNRAGQVVLSIHTQDGSVKTFRVFAPSSKQNTNQSSRG